MVQKSILFVCTGNLFRSVSAELSFKKYLSDHKITGWKVASAGTRAMPEDPAPKIRQVLLSLGMDNQGRVQVKLTKDLLDKYDIVVGMSQDHVDFMKNRFGFTKAVLFNELATGERTSVWDIDHLPDYLTNRTAVEEMVEKTIKYIYEKTPAVYKRASKA